MKAIERVMLEFAVVSTLALALAITANVAGRQLFGWFVALLAMLPLIYASWRNLSGSWSSGEFYDGLLGIPRWPMKLVFLLGLVMMTIRLVLVALEDLAELQRTGTVTIQSHTEEESV